MIETALVMPLMVFIVLGLLQLGLLQQGRSMAKYAAFKAVRAGVLHNASTKVMERAALAVLLPMVGYATSAGGETYNRTRDSGDLGTAWGRMQSNEYADASPLKVVQVVICNPTTKTVSGSVDFDDPALMNSAAGGAAIDNGKLSVQVTFYYRLVIPFANMVIWNITRANEVAETTIRDLRLGSTKTPTEGYRKKIGASGDDAVDQFGIQHKYFLPVRANFALRMQSNFLDGDAYKLPADNNCVLQFKKQGG
jgi:hypothetical protein